MPDLSSGIKPVPPTLGVRSPNHWITREVPWTVELFNASKMIQMCSKVWEPLIEGIYRREDVSLTIILLGDWVQ